MSSQDFIFSLTISEKGLAEGKRPPLCDGCGSAFDSSEKGEYIVNALILDGERFYGLECEECIRRYFSKLPRLAENAVNKSIRQSVRLELAQEMQVYFSPF